MPTLIETRNPAEIESFEIEHPIQALNPQVFERNRPDAHWMLVDGNRLLGRLSIWHRVAPELEEYTVGLIGHYAALDVAASDRLLKHACDELAARGCDIAIGPMDGNTLQRYRFITERGEEPPFLLEPDNPDKWPMYWRAQGFQPISHYYSSINTDLSQEDPRIRQITSRMQDAGISIRSMNPNALEDDLRRIYQISAISFRNNFLYVPFTEDEFLALNTPLLQYVDPAQIFIAEREREPVGFMFSIPNLLQKQRGEAVDTIIMKTFAVLPGRRYAGLGSLLAARTHRMALESGYKRAIHALMYEENNSLNISNRFSKPFRRYTLFSKELKP